MVGDVSRAVTELSPVVRERCRNGRDVSASARELAPMVVEISPNRGPAAGTAGEQS